MNLKTAVANTKSGHQLVAANGCRKSGCHPKGDLLSSWTLLTPNAEWVGDAAQLPDLG